MSGIRENNWILKSASGWISHNTLFWLKYNEENLTSQRHVIGKGRSILIVFPDNWGYFSLMLQQNLTNFLKVSCSVESEIMSMNFSCAFILKPIGLSYTWNGFSYSWMIFLIACNGHLDNIDSLSYEDLTNVRHFITQYQKKSHLLRSLPSHRKNL